MQQLIIIVLYYFCRFNLGGYSCQHCFHLLGVDVILDDSLHPIVIEVSHASNDQETGT